METIINSVLCFINSANADYSTDSLSDVIYSFYSHDEIKAAKEVLFNLLKKELVWRRDPDKKRKDLKDLLDGYEEFKSSKIKVNLVTNSHKKMPPVGLEMFAPILNNLAEDINKINDILPKILDIKCEVVNTADTVRQMKIEMHELNGKFSTAVNGMTEAAMDLATNECSVLEELTSFRQSVAIEDEVIKEIDRIRRSSLGGGGISYAEALTPKAGENTREQARNSNSHKQSEQNMMEYQTLVTDPSTGATSKRKCGNAQVCDGVDAKGCSNSSGSPNADAVTRSEDSFQDGWILVDSKKKRKLRDSEVKKRKPAGVTGSLKPSGGLAFKAAVRVADIFVGRVHKDVSSDTIKNYLKNTFNVIIHNVEQLEIKSERVNAFKVTLELSDRDKLFSADKWAEGILVNKFYSRSKNILKDRNS